jgi:hypothetical protein
LAIAYPSRKAALGVAALLVVSFVVMPTWPAAWVHALAATNHVILALQPGGAVLLLSLLRWRSPEGRLLAAFACVPQTPALYETIPLFLIPRSRWGGYALAVLSLLATVLMRRAKPLVVGMPIEENLASRWPIMFWFIYLPALLMVLWPIIGPRLDAWLSPRLRHTS